VRINNRVIVVRVFGKEETAAAVIDCGRASPVDAGVGAAQRL
jgi:hypothetical protein